MGCVCWELYDCLFIYFFDSWGNLLLIYLDLIKGFLKFWLFVSFQYVVEYILSFFWFFNIEIKLWGENIHDQYKICIFINMILCDTS